ncbi:MAG: DUF6635 family protein [Geminicoccaceae bacterium]
MPTTAEAEVDDQIAPVGDAEAQAIVERAIECYIAARHARVEGFVDRHFGLIGSLRLHRQALGLDLVRAPANVLLMLPYLTMRLGSAGLRRLGAQGAARWLGNRTPFLDTDVARELGWRLHAELLELPYDDGRRRCARDALAEAILADPGVAAAVDRLDAVARRQAHDPEQQARLRRLLAAYASTRAAAADLVNNVLLASTGMAAFHKLTPGTLTLGPVLAAALAQQAAVASFPLGSALGGLWYGWFPAAPSAGLVAGATGGLVLLTATTAAFAGVIADPVQRAFGLHQRRLHRLIDALGRELEGDSAAAFHARDHYVARIFDLIDLARATYRAI